MSKSIALTMASKGYKIRVNTVHPGLVETPMTADYFGVPEIKKMQMAAHPYANSVGRMGIPSDISSICLFLASDESPYMTGSEVVCDGGYTAI